MKRAHRINGARIELAIIKLQGLFIKVGQLISIMTNFLPDEFSLQLKGLQNNVPPRPFADIKERIQEEFPGKTPSDLFLKFDEEPIASASVGQVHLAKMHDGTRVAVKVQYPGIESLVRRDLRILSRIFKIAGRFLHYSGLPEVYKEIRSMIVEELDFTIEAENGRLVGAGYRERSDVHFPTVVPSLSTSRVLTSHFEPGFKIDDVERLDEAGIDSTKLATHIVALYCEQIFEHGIYHADPHPGNLLVRTSEASPTGFTVVFLDFGAVARVSPDMRRGLAELVQGALTRDRSKIIRAMREMGFVSRNADEAVFEQVVEFFYEKFEQQISIDSFNLRDVRFDPEQALDNLADLRHMDLSLKEMSSNFHVPKEWILLERTLLLLMGLCTRLAPQLTPVPIIRPHIEKLLLGDFNDWQEFVVSAGRDWLLATSALPGEIRKFIKHVEQRGPKIRLPGMVHHAEVVHQGMTTLSSTALAIALAGLAVYFEAIEDSRSAYAWWGAGGFVVLTALSRLRSRRSLRNWQSTERRMARK